MGAVSVMDDGPGLLEPGAVVSIGRGAGGVPMVKSGVLQSASVGNTIVNRPGLSHIGN